jgi:hypothetical protein
LPVADLTMSRRLSSSRTIVFGEEEIRQKRRRFFIFFPANAIYHISNDYRGLVARVSGEGVVSARFLRWHGACRAATNCVNWRPPVKRTFDERSYHQL